MNQPMHTRLRGMTWRHDRAVAPLEACSRIWLEQHGVEIVWEARSLQDFETYPLDELAQRYDLLVIDHPHVGIAADAQCLLPFDKTRFDGADYVGQSLASYIWQDQLWALPIDAAAQVQAYRPAAGSALLTYQAALDCKAGALAIPLLPPHGLLSLLTLYHQGGATLEAKGLNLKRGAAAFDLLAALVARVDPWCHTADPIAVLEAMAEPTAVVASAPIIFGYVNYAMPGYRRTEIAFSDLPALKDSVKGSVLGGTGLAVSASCSHSGEAFAFAHWVAGRAVQAGPYVHAAGQPGHVGAWGSEEANAATAQFFRATRKTLDGAWVRPRHAGFIEFQSDASQLVNSALLANRPGDVVVRQLNEMLGRSTHG